MLRLRPAVSLSHLLLAGALACTASESARDADVAAATDTAPAADAVPVVDTVSPDAADVVERPPHLVGPVDGPGPFDVGFRVVEVTYTPTAATDGEPLVLPARTLRLAVWYPAGARLGDPATYTLGITRLNVYSDAPVLAGPPAPVFVYSHGHQGFAEASYFLNEFFASHGYIALAPEHTGNTFFESPDRTTDSYLVRPLDIRAVLDWLYGLPPEDPLAGRAGDTVILAGHSYGGHTALATAGGVWQIDKAQADCAAGSTSPFCVGLDAAHVAAYRHGLGDPRIDAAITLAAGDAFAFTPDGLRDLAVPTLLITGGRDLASADPMSGDLLWNALPDGDRFARLAMPDAAHLTFTVTCEELGQLTEGDGCDGPPYLDPVEAHRVIDTYALAFVRAHLDDDATGWDVLLGRLPIAPASTATFTTH